jgi:hypothetical protein
MSDNDLLPVVEALLQCLTQQQATTVSMMTELLARQQEEHKTYLAATTSSFRISIQEVTTSLSQMAENLLLGRDSPSPSESLPMSLNEPESYAEPEIDLNDLPATASWAMEEERPTMPWQSSTPLRDSELPQ